MRLNLDAERCDPALKSENRAIVQSAILAIERFRNALLLPAPLPEGQPSS